MSQIGNPQDFMSAFGSLKGVLATAQSSTGKIGNIERLGPCPKKGVSNNILRDIVVDPHSSIKWGESEVPGTTIQFLWTTYENPDYGTPLEWQGTPFEIPRDPAHFLNAKGERSDKGANKGEVKKTKQFYDLGRLKGLLKCILGREVSDENFGADVYKAVQIAKSTTVVMELNMKFQEDDDYASRSEFGVKSLSGAAT